VAIVQDPDETLALTEIKAAAEAIGSVEVFSGEEPAAASRLDELAEFDPTADETTSVVVICDFLACVGANPVAARKIRKVALQQRPEGAPFDRLILLERPETEIPPSLASDIEVIAPKLPTVDDLLAELAVFLEGQPDAEPEGNGETSYAIATAGQGLPRHEFSRLLARSVIETGSLDAGWIRKEKALRIAQKFGGALTFLDPKGADVGGLDALRTWLVTRFKAFASKAAALFGLPQPKGVIICGVPGNAKTLTAKALARANDLPLIALQPGLLKGSLMGATQAKTKQATEAIDACAPCVCIIDEVDKSLAGIKGSGETDGGTSKDQGGILLTWFQDRTAPVFIVATANRMEDLPPEMLRPGRFDAIFAVDLPTAAEREEIAGIHLNMRGRGHIDAAAIAQATPEFSGAEIEQVVIDGMFAAFEADRELELADCLTAAKGRTPMSKTAADDIKKIRKWVTDGKAQPATTPTTAKKTEKGLQRSQFRASGLNPRKVG
jgi:hypothetical protein